jgi:hypothetical protein
VANGNITYKELVDLLKNSKVASINNLPDPEKESKKHKYGAKAIVIDGIRFASIREAKRYTTLKMLEKIGEIRNLKLQVPFELNPGGSHSLKYVADFVYDQVATGETIVEDPKGYRTKEYKKKKRLMAEVFGIEIKEV